MLNLNSKELDLGGLNDPGIAFAHSPERTGGASLLVAFACIGEGIPDVVGVLVNEWGSSIADVVVVASMPNFSSDG